MREKKNSAILSFKRVLPLFCCKHFSLSVYIEDITLHLLEKGGGILRGIFQTLTWPLKHLPVSGFDQLLPAITYHCLSCRYVHWVVTDLPLLELQSGWLTTARATDMYTEWSAGHCFCGQVHATDNGHVHWPRTLWEHHSGYWQLKIYSQTASSTWTLYLLQQYLNITLLCCYQRKANEINKSWIKSQSYWWAKKK